MQQIYNEASTNHLKNALRRVVFPTNGRTQMLFLSIKKWKTVTKNYRPISLLPISGKVLERLLYNSMFKFYIQNNLITPNQSGFKTGDSQNIQIIRRWLQSTGCISWYIESIWQSMAPRSYYKLRQNSVSGKLLNTLMNFLDNRTQRVILNDQKSSWAKIEAGVPQGSILVPLLFLIYINDLPENSASNPKLFTDDTSLFSIVKNVDASNIDLNNDLKKSIPMENVLQSWSY